MEKKCCFECSHCFYFGKEKNDCYDTTLLICEDKNEIMDEFYAISRVCKNFNFNDGHMEDYRKKQKKSN